MKWILAFVLIGQAAWSAAQGPNVLIVTTHPDDETTFPVTIYKITKDLKGTADLALITDAQGGFNGSELGSEYYGINLTDSVIGRQYLPGIRKQELLNAGRIIGIRNYFFFDQTDDYYSTNPEPYIGGARWDMPLIEKKMDGILERGNYDFIFVLLPHSGQHGHHKTASIVALRAVQRFKGPKKPLVLGGSKANKDNYDATAFGQLDKFPETRIMKNAPVFFFDRSAPFGHRNLLTYLIINDWVINEYKSQGDVQNNAMHKADYETFRYFDLNPDAGVTIVQQLFDALKKSGFPDGNPKR